jgi:hypothetical protein
MIPPFDPDESRLGERGSGRTGSEQGQELTEDSAPAQEPFEGPEGTR